MTEVYAWFLCITRRIGLLGFVVITPFLRSVVAERV